MWLEIVSHNGFDTEVYDPRSAHYCRGRTNAPAPRTRILGLAYKLPRNPVSTYLVNWLHFFSNTMQLLWGVNCNFNYQNS